MAKRRHPELDGPIGFQNLYTFELKSQLKTRRDRLFWTFAGFMLGAALVIGCYMFIPGLAERSPLFDSEERSQSSAFRQGIEKAMRAAQETQRAKYKEEWVTVAMLWQEAIEHMHMVPSSDAHYTVARQKIEEYGRNLQYAQSNVETREPLNPGSQPFWTVGSPRTEVITIEGTPSQVLRYDALCQEVLYYGSNRVELVHGRVNRYENVDGNLQVLMANTGSALIVQGDRRFWTLGSSKNDVLRLEGSPTRIKDYAALDREVLYYGDSSIDLENGQVVGYRDYDRQFQVAIESAISGDLSFNPEEGQQFWSLGSSRDKVLQLQQDAPTQIIRDDAACEEVLHYGRSTVELKHGVVSGYNNTDNNLRVQ